MTIHIIDSNISRDQLKHIAKETFENMVKAVVDVEKGILAVGGELHVDANSELLKLGSRQADLWGINLYPDKTKSWIEYISLINIRPGAGNPSMTIRDPKLRKRIASIVEGLVD